MLGRLARNLRTLSWPGSWLRARDAARPAGYRPWRGSTANRPTVIVGILTCRSVTDRRQACLDTWVRRLKQHGVRVVFLVGGVEKTRLDGDVLHVACPDDYVSLAYKTKLFAQWALKERFDYLFKCDDDTFVVADRFVAYDPEGHDYIGIDPVDDVNPRFASGGAGFWLSRRAAKIVAEMDIPRVAATANIKGWSAEDYIVYTALNEQGIRFRFDRRFQAWNQPHRRPKPSNEVVTVHYIKPADMRKLDAYFDELASIDGYAGLDRGGNSRFARLLGRLQVDWMGSLGRNSGPILLQESLSVMGEGAHQAALRLGQPAFTYLRDLHEYENFRHCPLPYDLDYIPLVRSDNPLNRDRRASYLFARKWHRVPDGSLFGRAPYKCNYLTRYVLSGFVDCVDSSGCGPSLIDKLRHQNKYRFAIACENMIATGYITEKLLDCFMADTVPIYFGAGLPAYLEDCVYRVRDTSTVETIHQGIRDILATPDDEYRRKLHAIHEMRFSHELWEDCSYQRLFDRLGVGVDVSELRFDGTSRS